MTSDDWRHSWIARRFICSLPSPWCWPKAYGIEDMNDDRQWADVGRKMAEGKSHLPRGYPDEYARAAAYVESLQ